MQNEWKIDEQTNLSKLRTRHNKVSVSKRFNRRSILLQVLRFSGKYAPFARINRFLTRHRYRVDNNDRNPGAACPVRCSSHNSPDLFLYRGFS